jgi:hypothetical protein
MLHNAPQPGSKAHEAHLARQAAKAAKKSAKNGEEPADAVPPAPGAQTKGGAKSVNGTAAKTAAGSKATGIKEIEDARPKPQRNQPSRTSRSGRKK